MVKLIWTVVFLIGCSGEAFTSSESSESFGEDAGTSVCDESCVLPARPPPTSDPAVSGLEAGGIGIGKTCETLCDSERWNPDVEGDEDAGEYGNSESGGASSGGAGGSKSTEVGAAGGGDSSGGAGGSKSIEGGGTGGIAAPAASSGGSTGEGGYSTSGGSSGGDSTEVVGSGTAGGSSGTSNIAGGTSIGEPCTDAVYCDTPENGVSTCGGNPYVCGFYCEATYVREGDACVIPEDLCQTSSECPECPVEGLTTKQCCAPYEFLHQRTPEANRDAALGQKVCNCANVDREGVTRENCQ